MYIRVLNFKTDGNKKAEVLDIINDIMPKIRARKGCKDCMLTLREKDNHYVFLVFWETKEDADASALVIGPQLLPALDSIATEPVAPNLFEVYEPVAAAK